LKRKLSHRITMAQIAGWPTGEESAANRRRKLLQKSTYNFSQFYESK